MNRFGLGWLSTSALRVALLYFALGALWAYLSHGPLGTSKLDPGGLIERGTYREWILVVLNAVVLYWLVWTRRQSEKARQEIDARYRELVENALVGVYQTRLDGTILLANPELARLLQFDSPTDMIGTSLVPRYRNSQDRARLLEILERDQQVRNLETEVLTRDGQTRTVLLSARLAGDTLTGMVLDTSERNQAEQQVRHLAMLLESTNDAIVASDAQYRLTAWNAVAESMYGWKAEEVLGRNGIEILRTEWPSADAEHMRCAIAAAGRWHGEATQIRKDGTRIPVEISSRVLRGSDGHPTGYVSVNRDITERKRAEQVLRDNELRFRALIENSADGITLLDAQGRVIWDSPAAPRMLGYSPSDWIGKAVFQLLHPDDVPAIEDLFKKLATTPGARLDSTLRVRSKNGSWLWLEAHATNLLAEPSVKAIVVNYRDITGQKMADEQLAASEAELRALFAAMSDVVAVYDREGNYLQIAPTNPINLYAPRGDMLGRRAHEILPKELADFFVTRIGQVLETGGTNQCEYALQVEGKEVFFSATAAPLSENTVIWVAHDITDRRQADKALKQQLQRLAALHAIDEAIAGSTNVSLVLGMILEKVSSQLGAGAADILLYSPVSGVLEYASGVGFGTETLQHTRLAIGQGYAGKAAMQRQLVHIPDLRDRETDFLRSPSFSQEGFVTYFGVPLIAKGKIEGVLEVFHRAAFAAQPDWLDLLHALAQQAAIAIDSAKLFEDLERSNMQLGMAYDATIEGWSRALDMRDKETEGHAQRVTEMTMGIARELGMGEAELVHIRRGALLHDIGKMGVPDAILLKPGPLTDDEWVLMKRHPSLAYEMLVPVEYLRPALDIPYCHHEKWDGTGYPRGLKAEQIPLAARIFAVVDVYDALTSDRPYRPAWTRERAIEHIREGAGTHFDPQVVDQFLQIAEQAPAA